MDDTTLFFFLVGSADHWFHICYNNNIITHDQLIRLLDACTTQDKIDMLAQICKELGPDVNYCRPTVVGKISMNLPPCPPNFPYISYDELPLQDSEFKRMMLMRARLFLFNEDFDPLRSYKIRGFCRTHKCFTMTEIVE